MNWDSIRQAFEHDGALRDIYVLDVDVIDWDAVWNALVTLEPKPRLSWRDGPSTLPERMDWNALFNGSFSERPILHVDFGGMDFSCMFFVRSEIEFSFDPIDVRSQKHAESLSRFIELVGRSTGKAAILTMENVKDAVIATYRPEQDEVVWREV